MKFDKQTYILPANWASYLINCDSSGLSGEEISDCNFFTTTRGVNGYCVDCGETFFHHKNDFEHKGGDVCEYTFLIPKST